MVFSLVHDLNFGSQVHYLTTKIQIMNEAVCISHNTLGKCVNPTIFPYSYG